MKNKILVVDDITKNIQLLASILGKEGYDVSYATSGKKALEIVQTGGFDLILLDIMMPEMNGFEVCLRLKNDSTTRDIPVLFLTAKSEDHDIVKGLQMGAVDYLTKPFNSAELIARVKTHITLRRSQLHLQELNSELLDKTNELQRLLQENEKMMKEVKILQGILPICANCKKIRDDDGYWTQLESYIRDHSEASFTHSICKECAKLLYPELE